MEYPWPVDEQYRLYAEVFRGYLGICEQGVNYLKEKKVLMNAMATAYKAYLRNSRKLTGLELQLIRGRTTSDNANAIVNQVHDSYQNWETKSRAYYKYRPGVADSSLKGAVLILGELVILARDNMGFERLMDARARNDGVWQYDDYKLLMRYTDLDIESGDVKIITEQEEINMEVSRKIYDRIGSAPVAPVVAPPERHPDRIVMDRDE